MQGVCQPAPDEKNDYRVKFLTSLSAYTTYTAVSAGASPGLCSFEHPRFTMTAPVSGQRQQPLVTVREPLQQLPQTGADSLTGTKGRPQQRGSALGDLVNPFPSTVLAGGAHGLTKCQGLS